MIYDFNLYVIRHGEAPSNVLNIVSGWSKEGLTEKGIGQVYKMKNEMNYPAASSGVSKSSDVMLLDILYGKQDC